MQLWATPSIVVRKAPRASGDELIPQLFARSISFNTVRQLRTVLIVPSFESKYWFVSLVRAMPLGQQR